MSLSFLQLSDVHFDAPLRAGKLRLDSRRASQRERERREAFRAAFALVKVRNLDGVLIPGDLFDDELVKSDTLRFVAEILASIAPKPVFLAPGNHDAYGGVSPYRQEQGEGTRDFRWPENVQLFAHEDFRSVSWPQRPEISVTACGVAANLPSSLRRLASPVERPRSEIPILLFHGSRDDGGYLQSQKATYPFSEDELRAQGFAWTALGHYHQHQVLHGASGVAIGAYSGSLLAAGLDELGQKGALVVELDESGPHPEFVPLDPRELRVVDCELSSCTYMDAAQARVEEALGQSGAREQDLVYLKLSGRRARGLELGFLEEIASRYFHFVSDLSHLTPDVDLDRYPPLSEARTTEERFVAQLRQRLKESEGEEAETVRRALLYGLDALSTGRLDSHYEA
ncbi:MAG TPA: metallophosphoesterase [Candidatus Krumholzibacteria bacterium]|nr:metallophosphoesterase [Candidatus Krumholzibacteria bacterium]